LEIHDTLGGIVFQANEIDWNVDGRVIDFSEESTGVIGLFARSEDASTFPRMIHPQKRRLIGCKLLVSKED